MIGEHPRDPATLRVSVDRAMCIGSGTCVRLARGAFALDTQRTAIVVDATAVSPEHLRRAERACPTGAVFVEET
jgi:ferredoxin